MAKKLPCEGNKKITGCRETYEIYGEPPPCGNSAEPNFNRCPHITTRLWPENADAWSIYRRTCNQHRMGYAGPVALDLVPVFEMMDRMRIARKDQIDLADLVTRVYHAVLAETLS